MATNPKVEAVSGWRLAVGNPTDSRGDRKPGAPANHPVSGFRFVFIVPATCHPGPPPAT